MSDPQLRTPRVAIIGAGMSGIGMGCDLRRAGIETFRIFEKWDGVGGTWHANTYPGLHCDVPSRNYQFRFAPNPNWSRVFSPGPEIRAYLERVVDDFQLRDRISLRTEVDEAVWDEDRHVWTLTTKAGEVSEWDFVITACGGLVETRTPDIPGLDDFEGARFHSAEWDHSVPLEGKRVAVIGTGSTGMQITKGLAGVAGHFELYQRTPQWILPIPNRRYTRLTKWAMRRFGDQLEPLFFAGHQKLTEGSFGVAVVQPGWQRRLLSWMCRKHLDWTVRDPELRRRFTPDDLPMCKRLIIGTGFYQLFRRPDVELVDVGIDHIEARGIVTTDGVLHEQDVIVTATGFNAHQFVRPMELVGLEGRRLSDAWGEREPYGYRSVAIPGFPNVFMLIGPHSPFGNQSLFIISETQRAFAMGWIERWRRGEIAWATPTDEAAERFNAEMKQALPNTIWTSGCSSWYIGKDGLPSVWPWQASHHREILREPEPADWLVEQPREREPAHA
ncbi:flavin-containing monooxygenase [Paraconexibacter algicola]|uniref:Monooxygenase n=1 Tax=Paraconexibacter algicola TaxID=2133960 RepID=A0A2T4UKD0_9ACTN|nr:NAD(P)/FAD-dependent oxidoreductase [Paraconexibacter algicola]PTL59648.1 monooxygenase [Paraconexibacter algicola]